ncbi:MAG: acyl carrier protein [Clostridia bacterium]|nr:acyl carrier protein [Clostridia bacterium]
MFEEIKNILAAQLGVDVEQITEESDIEEDLGADSLDVVELLATLEEEHGIYIADEDVLAMRTVGDVLAYIETSAL